MSYLIVFLGAGAGGALRHGFNLGAARLFGTGFPFGTLGVNVIGSFIMGLLAGYFAFKGEASQTWRLLLTTGVLGGFTTFSSFSAESLGLLQRGDVGLALLHSAAHLLGALGCCALGFVLARWVLH